MVESQRDSYMSIDSANEITITANNTLTTLKKPTNNQTPPNNRDTKSKHSLHLPFRLAMLTLEPEKQVKRTKFQILVLQRISF